MLVAWEYHEEQKAEVKTAATIEVPFYENQFSVSSPDSSRSETGFSAYVSSKPNGTDASQNQSGDPSKTLKDSSVTEANPGNNNDSNSNNNNSFVVAPAAYNGNDNAVGNSLSKSNTVSFSFAVIGDSQGFDANDPKGSLRKAVENVQKANPNLVVVVGDLISSCDGSNSCKSKYDDWKRVMQPIFDKTAEVAGNHDRTGKNAADRIWREEFSLPANGPAGYSELVYSFDLKDSHFVILDSEKSKEHLIDKVQRDWLERDLATNKKENIFVFYHEPAYPASSKIDESLDVEKDDRDALWSIFRKYKVTAVFSGHEHIMSRRSVDGIYQFVVGNTDTFNHDLPGPGMAEYSYRGHHYALVIVKGKEVTVNVYAINGNLLNSFTLPR